MNDPVYWSRVAAKAAHLKSDGCTLSLDIFIECCWEHDIARRTGRTVEGAPVSARERNAMFRRCIQARSKLGRLSPMSWWRWAAVTVRDLFPYST